MEANRRGFLVAIEGIDGSGKSTQCELLWAALDGKTAPAMIIKAKTKEQNGPLNNFLKAFGISHDSVAFTLLYQAIHRQQFEATSLHLGQGKMVIADRWNPSFFVFHNLFGYLAERPDARKLLDDMAFEGLEPDICFLMDIPVDIAFQRRSQRKNEHPPNNSEREFYEKIAAEYKKLAAEKGWIVIDAQLPISEIHRQIITVVGTVLS